MLNFITLFLRTFNSKVFYQLIKIVNIFLINLTTKHAITCIGQITIFYTNIVNICILYLIEKNILNIYKMNSVKVSSNVIDEMFPEGPETMMMELDEVIQQQTINWHSNNIVMFKIKPITASGFNMELANNVKIIHTDFYNSKFC